MNKLTAAVTLFGYEPPEGAGLREFVVRVALAVFGVKLNGTPSPYADEKVVGALVRAYANVLANEAEDKGARELVLIEGRVADNDGLWREHALKGVRAFLPDTPADSEVVPWWPDEFPLDTFYPKGLLCDLAYLAGYVEGERTTAAYKFTQREDTANHKEGGQ